VNVRPIGYTLYVSTIYYWYYLETLKDPILQYITKQAPISYKLHFEISDLKMHTTLLTRAANSAVKAGRGMVVRMLCRLISQCVRNGDGETLVPA
jgi:hypothetical protein